MNSEGVEAVFLPKADPTFAPQLDSAELVFLLSLSHTHSQQLSPAMGFFPFAFSAYPSMKDVR